MDESVVLLLLMCVCVYDVLVVGVVDGLGDDDDDDKNMWLID